MATDSSQLLADKKVQLAEVQAAISQALKQQSYKLNDGQADQTVARALLKDLTDREEKLEADILALVAYHDNFVLVAYYARPA